MAAVRRHCAVVINVAVYCLVCASGRQSTHISDDELARGCGNSPADVIFVLDESGSIWGPDFTRQLQFVKDVVGVFDVRHDVTRIGVMTFDNTPKKVMDLGSYSNLEDISAVLDQVVQQRGGTETYYALEYLRETMFAPRMRPGIPQIGIVITDGESDYPDLTAREAMLTKDSHITMFAIGVGQSINQQELRDIASTPTERYMFTVENYDSLASLKNILGWTACHVATTTTSTTTTTTTTTTSTLPTTTLPQMIEGCLGHSPIDLMFALPDQAGIHDTWLALTFVNNIVQEAEISSFQVQAGLVPRGPFRVDGIRLGDHGDKTAFQVDVSHKDLSLLGTYTDVQLSYLSEVAFSAEHGGREEALHMAVIVIDNHSVDRQMTLHTADVVKDAGVIIISIGIGEVIDREEVEEIASGYYSYFIDTYEDLHTLEDEILYLLCEGSSMSLSHGYYQQYDI